MTSFDDIKREFEGETAPKRRGRLKAGDDGVRLAEYDVRWFEGRDAEILAPAQPPALIITIPFQLKSQASGWSHNHFAAAARTKKCRRHAMHALDPISIDRVQAFFGTSPLTMLLIRLAPRSLDDDNLRTSLKPFRDQVCAWLAGKNTLDARANDSIRSGYTFDYKQQRQPEYGVRVELTT